MKLMKIMKHHPESMTVKKRKILVGQKTAAKFQPWNCSAKS